MQEHPYRQYIRSAAILGMVAGILVMAGWLFHVSMLTRVAQHYTSMKFNTAFCFLLAGLALLFYCNENRVSRALYRVACVLIVCTGLFTVLQDIFAINLGIDELFIRDTEMLSPHPGRMAALSSSCFILLGLSFFFLCSKNQLMQNIVQYMLHLVTLIALSAIVGYIYHEPLFYQMNFQSPVSLYTALVLFVMTIVAALVHPTLGIAGLLTGDRIGNLIARQLFPASALLLVLLGAFSIELEWKRVVSVEFGTALLVLTTLVAILVLIYFISRSLNRIDRKRSDAEEALKRMNRNQELIIAKRTAQLKGISETLELATNTANIGIWDVDLATGLVNGNEIFYTMLGFDPASSPFTLEQLQAVTHPDDLEHLTREFEKSETTGQLNYEYRAIRPNDKTIRIIKVQGAILLNSEGQPIRVLGANTDVTAQREQMQQLRQSEERFAKMVAEVKDYSIILLDVNGCIANWNKGAERIKGYSAAEAVGQHFSIFYTAEDREKRLPWKLLEEAMQNGRAINEGWRVRKDGSVLWALVTITALYDETNNVIGFSKVMHDLTLREAEAAARKEASVLEARNKELEQFAYIASHDLQEPLRTVSNYITVLEEDNAAELSADAQGYIRSIARASDRMSSMVTALLEYSRLGAQRQRKETDLKKLAEEVRDSMSESIRNAGAEISIGDLPVLKVYETECRQLFHDLIDNALKFRKKDEPCTVQINARPMDGKWMFTVTDNGIGIEEKHFVRIFFIFQRLYSKDLYEGNGIGLANCKKIVELHGGEIGVESEPGKGSTFYFTIASS